MISIIVAIDEKRGIGKNNDLLFRIPEDLKRFKEKTKGHAIIMGRKTFDSIGRALPSRVNIVVTRDTSKMIEGCVMAHSLEDAVKKAQKEILNTSYSILHTDKNEIFIIGGGQIFKEALEKNLVDRLYLTIVKGDYGADTFFPDYSQFKTVVKKEEGRLGDYSYSFLDLVR